jgi:hypothetical protein
VQFDQRIDDARKECDQAPEAADEFNRSVHGPGSSWQ